MLVLSPTRELAAQIADNMKGYAKNLNLSVDCVFGGVPIGKQPAGWCRASTSSSPRQAACST
jgi:superfamily II DNA/RNA helicase